MSWEEYFRTGNTSNKRAFKSFAEANQFYIQHPELRGKEVAIIEKEK